MSLDLVGLGYLAAAAAHLLLLVYLVRAGDWRDSREPATACFVTAVAVTAVWAVVKAYDETLGLPRLPLAAALLDLLRYGLWFGFVLLLLRPAERPRFALSITGSIGFLLLGGGLAAQFLGFGRGAFGAVAGRLQLASWLGLSAYGLMLLEQLFRNQAEESRWNAKPVCLGLGCVFVYDLYVHAEAVMFGRFDEDALLVRGVIHALSAPLLFIASRRHHAWISKLRVSRNAAFYSASLLLIGSYLVFMAGVGYYVRFFGGTWGRALQLALLFAAVMLLLVLMFSGALRARLRVFLGKNFFSYRYDYRQEWLRFTAMLSTRGTPQEVGVLVVRGLADMLECPAGSLWSRGLGDDQFVQTAQWNTPRSGEQEPASSEFCNFMREKEWIIDIDEYRASPKRYGQLAIPRWLLIDASAWVVVPLIVADVMIGFVLLNKPRTTVELNWEVRDLLKTASRQAAGYLSRMHATEALLEARKFDAFNRMSAFVVHDLKNIITQLSLMLKNAQRLGDNPEFREDMLMTVESSLEKMRQLMAQLREGEKPAGVAAGVDLPKILRDIAAMAERRGRRLELTIVDSISTRGHEDRVARVLGHVVQNALDATPQSGRVWLTLRKDAGRAELVVGDTGAGMTPEFIRTSLFRPFSSTKQSGMGIGSYESFLYIKELGGTIDVASEVGKGTVMTILLPLFDVRTRNDLQLSSPT